MRAVAVILALVATPVLHGLSFPPTRLAPLAWFAFVPWFVALRLVGLRAALALSAVVTLAGTYLVARWLPAGVATYYGQSFALGAGLFFAAWTVTMSPWLLAFPACYRAAARRAAATLPLIVGAGWVGAELARVRIGLGNPFGLLGYSQVAMTPLVQIADVTGVYGVSFLVAAVNAALAEVCYARGWERARLGGAYRGLAVVAGAVAVALVYGTVRLHATLPAHPPTTVAVAQGNLDLGSQWQQEFYGVNLEEYMRLTLDVVRRERPALVFWPESAMTFFVEDEPLYRTALGRLLAPGGVELVAGGPRKDGAGAERYHNSAFLLSPDGRITARYDKERLLPFAEYFPLDSVELLRREFGRVRTFVPGVPTPPLPTVAGPAGIVICNEAMFPELVRARVRDGAAYLVNLTNDSWLGDTQFSAQAFDMARLRAIEERRYVVRASTSGPSAIIDPFGRVLAETRPSSRATVSGTVRAIDAETPYARVGDAFAFGCAVVAVTAAALSRSRPARR